MNNSKNRDIDIDKKNTIIYVILVHNLNDCDICRKKINVFLN